MKIGLLGFGRTGRLVAQEIIREPGFELTWVLRRSRAASGEYASHVIEFGLDEGPIYCIDDMDKSFFEQNPVEAVVDFSSAGGIRKYLHLLPSGVHVISAISRYSEEEIRLLKEAGKERVVLWSPNITVGINILIVASRIIKEMIPFADIGIVEEHFREKPEISGTAVKIAQQLGLDESAAINSLRLGGIVGKHEVIFGLPNQVVRLTHETNNRAAFGRGAVFAASLLRHKSAGFYTMETLVMEQFAEKLELMRRAG